MTIKELIYILEEMDQNLIVNVPFLTSIMLQDATGDDKKRLTFNVKPEVIGAKIVSESNGTEKYMCELIISREEVKISVEEVDQCSTWNKNEEIK